MSNILRYLGEGPVCRGPSPAIWGDLSKLEDDARFGKCILIHDDFAPAPALDENATVFDRGRNYCDTGVTIAPPDAVSDLSEALGEIEVAGNDADNDEGHVQFDTKNTLLRIDTTAGQEGKVMFEGRVKVASIADDGVAWFLGLASGPVGANYLVDDTGALKADEAFIGFRTLHADGDQVEFVFQAASQTVNTVVDAHTLVAGDYVKLGFVYDPNAVDVAKAIRIYVNGEELSTGVAVSEIQEATFPEGEGMSPVLLTKVGTAAEVKVTADSVTAAQYLDSGAAN